MKKHLHSILRWGIYLAGLALLAAGITLNSLTGLGASAIVSVPFAISQGTGLNFGNLTLVLYGLFVAAQLFLAGRQRSWSCLLQIPLSILFTRGMNLIKALVPYRSGYLPADLALLILAVLRATASCIACPKRPNVSWACAKTSSICAALAPPFLSELYLGTPFLGLEPARRSRCSGSAEQSPGLTVISAANC